MNVRARGHWSLQIIHPLHGLAWEKNRCSHGKFRGTLSKCRIQPLTDDCDQKLVIIFLPNIQCNSRVSKQASASRYRDIQTLDLNTDSYCAPGASFIFTVPKAQYSLNVLERSSALGHKVLQDRELHPLPCLKAESRHQSHPKRPKVRSSRRADDYGFHRCLLSLRPGLIHFSKSECV